MTNHVEDVFFQRFTNQISELLCQAFSLSKAAVTLSSQGLQDNAMETLFDVEPLIFEAKTLLNAAAVIRRYDQRSNETPQ